VKYRNNTANALDVVKLRTSQCLGLRVCMWNNHKYEWPEEHLEKLFAMDFNTRNKNLKFTFYRWFSS